MKGTTTRFVLTTIALLIATVIVIALSLRLGYADASAQIVWDIRAPRVLLAFLAGVGLALAGALLQGVFLNPLAAPSIVGVSASGAAGAVVGAAFGLSFNSLALAAVGAVVSGAAIAVVRAVATKDNEVNSTALLLGGIAMSFFALAVVLIATPFLDRAAGRSFSFWANGSFALATWNGVLAVLPFLIAGIAITIFIARFLDPLSLGAPAARALGIPVTRTTTWALAAVVLLVAPTVTVVGVIAFVGLVVPHAMRQVLGPKHATLLPASALAGGLLVCAADLVARQVLAPIELPVGAVTALVGAPVFLYLLRRMVRGSLVGAR